MVGEIFGRRVMYARLRAIPDLRHILSFRNRQIVIETYNNGLVMIDWSVPVNEEKYVASLAIPRR